MSFSTAWSTNAASICQSVGLTKVKRIELSRRYLLSASEPLTEKQLANFAAMVHDRMTEQVYPAPLTSFKVRVLFCIYRIIMILRTALRSDLCVGGEIRVEICGTFSVPCALASSKGEKHTDIYIKKAVT